MMDGSNFGQWDDRRRLFGALANEESKLSSYRDDQLYSRLGASGPASHQRSDSNAPRWSSQPTMMSPSSHASSSLGNVGMHGLAQFSQSSSLVGSSNTAAPGFSDLQDLLMGEQARQQLRRFAETSLLNQLAFGGRQGSAIQDNFAPSSSLLQSQPFKVSARIGDDIRKVGRPGLSGENFCATSLSKPERQAAFPLPSRTQKTESAAVIGPLLGFNKTWNRLKEKAVGGRRGPKYEEAFVKEFFSRSIQSTDLNHLYRKVHGLSTSTEYGQERQKKRYKIA